MATHSNAVRLATASAIILPLAACCGIFWWGFSQPWGLVLGDAVLIEPQRLLPLVGVTVVALPPAVAIACYWRSHLWNAAPASWWLAVVTPAGVALAAIAAWALRIFPNSGDEYDYVFQAQTFLNGRLWNPLLPGQDLMSFSHIFEKDGKWVTQYQPGWPLLLAGANLLGLPFSVVGIVCGAALLAALWQLCREQENAATALIALLLVACTPYFAFNAASFFSHTAAALAGVLFCLWGARFIEQPSVLTALLSGAALGALGLIRAIDVPIFALPFTVQLLRRAQALHYRRIAVVALGGAPFLAALLLYNHAITGHALLPPTNWGYPLFRMGWPSVNEEGGTISGFAPVYMLLAHLVAFAEWTSPLLLLAYAPALAWRLWIRRGKFFDFVVPLNIVAYLFFPGSGGNEYGPRYYFDSFPLLATTVAALLADVGTRLTRPRIVSLAAGVGLGHVIIALAGFAMLAAAMRDVVNERMDVFDQVRQARLANAVVILRSGTGVKGPMAPRELTRNGITRDGSVIYALDMPARLDELRAMFPDRGFFVYERPADKVRGTLTLLDRKG